MTTSISLLVVKKLLYEIYLPPFASIITHFNILKDNSLRSCKWCSTKNQFKYTKNKFVQIKQKTTKRKTLKIVCQYKFSSQ